MDAKAGATVNAKVINLSVCRAGKYILNGVSFDIPSGTLTGIVGPNGAGKTTLMRALSGVRPDEGQFLINGEDMYANPRYWLKRIGYVPVENVLHDGLRLRVALVYVGRLRLPDSSTEEIEARVDRLLDEFDLASSGPEGEVSNDRRNTQVRLLSSGERKRANVCAELISDPPLLLLDEPTSNLDPDAERKLMELLARYAHDRNRTVVVITHTLNTIHFCDNIIFIENAHLTAQGKPEEALSALERSVGIDPGDEPHFDRWSRVFQHYQTRDGRRPYTGTAQNVRQKDVRSAHEFQPAPWSYQLRVLLERYIHVRRGDPWNLVMTTLAGLSGLLFFILPSRTFVQPFDETVVTGSLTLARQSVYLVAIAVGIIGLITSYMEISKEFRIYRHERLKGLLPSAYLMSKWLVLAVIVGIVAPVLILLSLLIVYQQPFPEFGIAGHGEVYTWLQNLWLVQLPGMFTQYSVWYTLVVLVVACMASVSVGLMVSALAADSERGFLYLAFVVVFLVLFSGLIYNQRMEEVVDTLSFLSTGKWAYEGMASAISLYCWMDGWRFVEFNSNGHVLSVLLGLFTLGLGAAVVAVILLYLRDPWFSTGKIVRTMVREHVGHIAALVVLFAVLFGAVSFLRQQSMDYHRLTYWSRQPVGGTGAYTYADVRNAPEATPLQYWNGRLSQSWCGDEDFISDEFEEEFEEEFDESSS